MASIMSEAPKPEPIWLKIVIERVQTHTHLAQVATPDALAEHLTKMAKLAADGGLGFEPVEDRITFHHLDAVIEKTSPDNYTVNRQAVQNAWDGIKGKIEQEQIMALAESDDVVDLAAKVAEFKESDRVLPPGTFKELTKPLQEEKAPRSDRPETDYPCCSACGFHAISFDH